jgi:predicted NBD/HSP70 family sugar kinase
MAGELRYLPSPFSDGAFANAEEALSSRGIVARYNRKQADGRGAARSAKDVFDRAAQGQPIAIDVLPEEAEGMGLLIAALTSVANPGAVILGGGIGQNPALHPFVQAVVRQMSLPVDIWSSELGESATVAGAALLARSLTLAELLGIHFDGNLLPVSWG